MIDTPLPPQAELQSEPETLPARSHGRVARSVIGYALLTALMIVSPLLVFVPTALFHCGLRNGRRAAWLVAVLAVALASLALLPGPKTDAMQTWSYLLGVVLAVALPSMAALPMVERGERFGRVLVFLLAGAAIGLAATEIVMQTVYSYSPYAQHLAQAQKTAREMTAAYKLPPQPSALVQKWGTYVLPAWILMDLALVFVLSLLMLGRLRAWREHAARRPADQLLGAYLFRNLSLPEWVLFLFVAGGLTPLAHGMLQKVAANVLAIATFLYLLQGLAIFRAVLVAAGTGFAGSMLGWMLLGVLMITGIGPLLLGLAGLFDPFFDFRHFKKRKDDSHESHSD